MDLELSSEQSLFIGSLEKLVAKYQQVPSEGAGYVLYSQEIHQELAESGYLGICLQEGYGLLDAALMVENVARLPFSVEVAASALLPHALKHELDGPIALSEGVGRPTRYLPGARHAIIDTADGLQLAELDGSEVRTLDSVVAYPVGVMTALPKRIERLTPELAGAVHSLWRLAIAAEAAGLMRGALDRTVAYVKERRQFKKPLGDFQAIQHRLSMDEQIVSATFLLAMRAAHSFNPQDITTAALYAQQHMRTIVYDCHQFTGAMGVTLEYPLHLWTYRLKFMQGELGGYTAQADRLADDVWPKQRSL